MQDLFLPQVMAHMAPHQHLFYISGGHCLLNATCLHKAEETFVSLRMK